MGPIDSSSMADVCQAVQHNCDISDARFARDYSLCIYLLRMREFYRWKNHIALGANIDTEALGTWVSDTESYWDAIEETDFRPLVIGGQTIDAFDAAAVNANLSDTGIVYSAGIGRLGQPHFCLAKLRQQSTVNDIVCIECDDELARDTITLPAMAQNGTVIIRHESFIQLLWQMVDEWNLKKPDGPMARLADHYGIDPDAKQPDAKQPDPKQIEEQIASAANELSGLLLQHEIGEVTAGRLLGKEFVDMAQSFQGKRGEMHIRAVRDLLADSLQTWPTIVREQSSVYLDFWLAGVHGYREVLLKQTSVLEQLKVESPVARLSVLAEIVEREQNRWQTIALELINEFRLHGDTLNIESIIKDGLSSTP